LRLIPSYSAEGERARRELKLAELEARCLAEPVDVAAHLELGRWWIRQLSDAKAQPIFKRLRDGRPDRPEGYYGLARIAFTDREKPLVERYNEAHDLCREALKRDPKFGLAYELLGTLFHNVSLGMGQGVAFEVEDSIEYYRRAIQCDPTCDIALRYVAESDLKKGQLHPAKEMLEQAAALETNDAGTYYVLAVIYQGTREFLKAEEAYRKAKELWPEVELDANYKQEILRVCGYEY
jgi:tetratricopeptide (TPR) repeat protein